MKRFTVQLPDDDYEKLKLISFYKGNWSMSAVIRESLNKIYANYYIKINIKNLKETK